VSNKGNFVPESESEADGVYRGAWVLFVRVVLDLGAMSVSNELTVELSMVSDFILLLSDESSRFRYRDMALETGVFDGRRPVSPVFLLFSSTAAMSSLNLGCLRIVQFSLELDRGLLKLCDIVFDEDKNNGFNHFVTKNKFYPRSIEQAINPFI